MKEGRFRHLLRQIGPVMATARHAEIWRAGLGAFAGILLLGWLAAMAGPGIGIFLIAPFGAGAVLLFAIPNSPLAQPWSSVMGNGASALAGIAATFLVEDLALRAGLACGGAVLLMHLMRALHPPGGAVALTAALSPDLVHELGLFFVFAPVMLGTALLVLMASVYGPATGRRYPFRQTDESRRDSRPGPERNPFGLSRDQLADLLADFRQSSNIGVEDLARLIAGAEDRAAHLRLDNLTCADVMSRNLVSVQADSSIAEVATLFARHGFTALPVTRADGRYLGMIFQIHLIRRASEEARRIDRGFVVGMVSLLARRQRGVVRARELMRVDGPHMRATDPVLELLPVLAVGHRDAVAVIDNERAVGIVTRTDLVATLARALTRPVL